MTRAWLHPPALLPFILACSATLFAEGGTFRGRLVVEDFESFTWGGEWATVQFSQGADPRMTRVRDEAHSGRQACGLHVPPGESLGLITQQGLRFVGKGDKPPLPLPGTPQSVGLWVRGTRSGHRLWLQLLDSQGKTTDVDLGPADFDGWGLMHGKVPPLAPPVGLRGLLVRGPTGSPHPEPAEGRGGPSSEPLVVDDVTVVTEAERPLYVDARPAAPDEELLGGQRARFRVTVQSLRAEPTEGRGEAAAFEAGSEKAVARQLFSFRVSEAEPFAAMLSLRLEAGVYDLVVRAEGAECRRQVVVYPAGPREPEVQAARAIRRFPERGDALRVYESALSPALLVETGSDRLTLFRGLSAVGLAGPQDGLIRTKSLPGRAQRGEMQEPWLLVWFGGSPKWGAVSFADGSPCPSFDVPFLVVFERRPTKVDLGDDGLQVEFSGPAGRLALMPFYGTHRRSPAETTRWKEDVPRIGRLAEQCRFWASAVRALPVDVCEEWRVDPTRDEVEVRSRFTYLETGSAWGGRAVRLAPVPPLLTLAWQAGLPVRVSPEPSLTSCDTSLGPYAAVSGADGATYTISGLFRHLRRVVADLPGGALPTPLTLARHYTALSTDAPRIPFWAREGGERGGPAIEALLRFMLWPANAHCEWDADGGRLRALDGLVWQEEGAEQAAAGAAEVLRGCWYAGFHAGLWDALAARWHHLESLRAALHPGGGWATLGLGPAPTDASLNAELFFARLAARLDRPEAFAEASARAAKLLIAGGALAVGAPAYAREHKPWPMAGEEGRPLVLSRCPPGSLGFAPGPPPFVTSPSDAGYSFAREHLGDYFRQSFRPGPLGFFGRSPADWAERRFVELDLPRVASRFRPAPRELGPYRGNYVFTVKAGPDGWPCLAWESHRAPAGGPLLFGSIGTQPATRGRLRRTVTVSPYLRLSAYQAIAAPPPPKEPDSPTPPAPGAPPAKPVGGTPARSRP